MSGLPSPFARYPHDRSCDSCGKVAPWNERLFPVTLQNTSGKYEGKFVCFACLGPAEDPPRGAA